ncbi:MAG: hypothetical protein PHT62_14355 [Desulfotomaculaceae bacterium]|nr:hypothetical protein [Desulfotomaculaceae bacterium]
MVIFNPFDHINKMDIKKRVQKLKKKKSNLSNEELCRLLIKKKSRLCALAGGATAMPGVVPGVGTLVAVVGGTLLDMTAMAFFITELILEVAAVYDRDLDVSGTSREAVWVLITSVGAGAAGSGLTRLTISQLTGSAFKRLIEQALVALGIRASQRSFFRIIPFIGMFIAGGVNYYTSQKVGSFVAKYYAENAYIDNWDGQTIDVKGEMKGE